MGKLSLISCLSRSLFYCDSYKTSKILISSSFSSVASPSQISNSNSSIVDYLVETFGFSKTQAISASNRFLWLKYPEKPKSVVRFFREIGFSETDIRSAVRVAPQILFSDVDKTLKPKLEFFQELGLSGSDLGHFVSKNSSLLTASLDRRLIPCTEILKKILSNNDHQRDLIRVLLKCKWVISVNPESRLLPNISFLESCGILGSKLSMLLKRQPTLFSIRESSLRELVRRLGEIGFPADSTMLVHALYTVSCLSPKTLLRKFQLLQSLGFSHEECLVMFRRTPALFRTSEKKLKLGIEFFMNTIKFKRAVLISRPALLMHSIEDRVIPRYRVMEILKSKKLLKKEPSFTNVVTLPEGEFLEKFISRFRDDAEELLVAYKSDALHSSMENK